MAGWLRLRDQVRRPVDRFRQGGREALWWTLRLTSGAVASYVLALALLAHSRPMLAPLTALLVIQATPVSLLSTGLDRVISVVIGVLMAVVVSTLVPLTWWSLAVVIALSLLIGQAIRLKSNLLEVPISAMLVLGVGSVDTEPAAWARFAETLVGAGVGVLLNLLFPPKVPTADVAESIDDLAARLTRLLRRAADEIAEVEGEGARIAAVADDCLTEARSITAAIPRLTAALEQVEEGRKLNVRMAREPDAAPGIRQGLEVLEHSAVAVRSMFRSIRDSSMDESWPRDDSSLDAAVDVVEVLGALAAAVAAFGVLVHMEATSRDLTAPDQITEVQQALDSMHSARTMLFARASDQNPALAELYVSLGSTVKRLRRELDLEDRARRLDIVRPARRPARRVIHPRGPRRRPEE